jgi:hypothetical protein
MENSKDEKKQSRDLREKQPRSPTQVIDFAHMALMEIQAELASFSYLLCAMGPCSVDGELHGLGLVLQRMHRRIENVASDLAALPRTKES